MQLKKKPEVDVIKDVLEAVLIASPRSEFVKSLYYQYQERGGLSKKQLQGLLYKCAKVKNIPEAKLATIEAIIRRKPMKTKSSLPDNTPVYVDDSAQQEKISYILQYLPEHKAVRVMQHKHTKHIPLTTQEIQDLDKILALVRKKFKG